MTYQAIPPVAGANDQANVALSRARQLLGTTINTVIGSDFEFGNYHTSAVAGTGAVAIVATSASAGLINLTTGATAGGLASVAPFGTGAGASEGYVGNPKTVMWYAKFRAALTSAGDAASQQTVNMFGTSMANPQILLGQFGSVHATQLSYVVISNAGATIASGTTASVTLDTNYHTWEMWCDTTTLTFAYDGTAIATVATSTANFPTNAVTPGSTVYNGATATARTMRVDRWFVCMPSN